MAFRYIYLTSTGNERSNGVVLHYIHNVSCFLFRNNMIKYTLEFCTADLRQVVKVKSRNCDIIEDRERGQFSKFMVCALSQG